jgi:hypothetical protein
MDRRAGGRSIAGSGLLLGLACTIRTVGLFVVPVWLVWLLLFPVGRRTVLLGLAGVAAPVVAYCTMHAVQGAGFGLVGGDGWYLYAKVAPIADCRGASVPAEARSLCAPPRSASFEFYLYDAASPAHQLFAGGRPTDLEDAITPRNNRILRRFSLAVIRAHPIPFARAVTKEFFRYLGPAAPQPELSLYGQPGTPVGFYEREVHVGWLVVAGGFAAGTALIWLGARGREASLLVAVSAAVVLSAAASSGFNIRYALPAVPLLVAAGGVAAEEALRAWHARAQRPSATA